MPRQRVAAPAPTVTELVAAYQPRDFLLTSASGTLLGSGALATVTGIDELADVLSRVGTDTGQAAVAVGALPFDRDAPAHLVVPETVRRGPAPEPAAAPAPRRSPLPGAWKAVPVPDPADHATAVKRAITLMTDPVAPELRKVVLARCLKLTGTCAADVAAVVANLVRADPVGFTFAADLPSRDAAPRTLVGASPELLVAKHGRSVVSHPLAGSAPRHPDPVQDREQAAALLSSAKERAEHAVVVEAVAEALRPYCRRLDVPEEPWTVTTATMWHLATRITGELRDPHTPSSLLARALHPTPAVCGSPTDRAYAAIAEIEPFDRGFYTGAVGYTDTAGDGEWVVTIRCADIHGSTVDLFAGGGIMPDSDPEAELAETTAKFRTLLRALGVDQTR
ncbi:isochorismate synthase [Thermobifida cellulosilytica]|uniref:isochorismate synthase n=1 Tax=Thermobifida cellulosilytica TB100 TaxID=665004 RepID=A0A147KK72_THECS|nr:isochorismate synthase [Thermobifida cellulosilytica]KUP97720.1 isochorismate synthase [Thermobifida cellulosilytica TB100]